MGDRGKGADKSIAKQPGFVLTYLAPSGRCNQRCPGCIIDRLNEPVRLFDLGPKDYQDILVELVEDGPPIRTVSFQGYEVTLPQSWPYVEAVFGAAARHELRRSFITNGMLLDRWTDRILALDPYRIAVSLDGADAETNDRLRGIRGAFDATTSSISRFLRIAPHFASRLTVVSTLYDEANAESLRAMPSVLASLGVERWALGFELILKNGRQTTATSKSTLTEWAHSLQILADAQGIRFYVNDEMGALRGQPGADTILRAKHLFDPKQLIRVQPNGQLRIGGDEITRPYEADPNRQWVRGQRSAAELVRAAFAAEAQSTSKHYEPVATALS